MTRPIAVAVTAAALSLAGCGDDDSDDAGRSQGGGEVAAPAQETTAQAPAKQGVTIKAAASDYGRILFDGRDRAIYLFGREGGPRSRCYGACAAAWPPVLTDGEPRAKAGVDASLLGTTRRDDGSSQVTYAGHPLYYYVDDPPGEVLCQNVEEFGGLWLVVQPSGDPIR